MMGDPKMLRCCLLSSQIILFILSIAVFATSSISAGQVPSTSVTEASDVIRLTTKNFARLMSKGRELSLVALLYPKDPRSDYVAPILELVATRLKGLVQVGTVDCSHSKTKEICDYFRVSVEQTPFVVVFKNEPTEDPLGHGFLGEGPYSGKDPVPYKETSWEPGKITDWVLNTFLHTRNILRVTFKNMDEFHAIKKMPKLYYFADNNEKPDKLLMALSMNFEKRMLFGLVKYDSIRVQQKFGVTQYPTLMILDTRFMMQFYKGKSDTAAIAKWVAKYALPERREDFEDPFTIKYKYDKYKEEL